MVLLWLLLQQQLDLVESDCKHKVNKKPFRICYYNLFSQNTRVISYSDLSHNFDKQMTLAQFDFRMIKPKTTFQFLPKLN